MTNENFDKMLNAISDASNHISQAQYQARQEVGSPQIMIDMCAETRKAFCDLYDALGEIVSGGNQCKQ